jgi:hypothetical protein
LSKGSNPNQPTNLGLVGGHPALDGVNAPRRNKRLPLLLHLVVEITDTCFPSLYISLLLTQIDNMNSFILIRTFATFTI